MTDTNPLLDAPVTLTVRQLLGIRRAAARSLYTSYDPEVDYLLSDTEHRALGIAPEREKRVVINVADLRHAQKHGVLDQFLDEAEASYDVTHVVALHTDWLLADAIEAAKSQPVAALDEPAAPTSTPVPKKGAEKPPVEKAEAPAPTTTPAPATPYGDFEDEF